MWEEVKMRDGVWMWERGQDERWGRDVGNGQDEGRGRDVGNGLG